MSAVNHASCPMLTYTLESDVVSTSSETYCLLLKLGWFQNDDFHVQTDYWSVRIVPVCMFFVCASCQAQEFLCKYNFS